MWRKPSPNPPARMSPSSLHELVLCPQRFAFSLDDSFRDHVRATTRTSLGIVAHRLKDEVSAGHAPPAGERSQWLETRWDDLISAQFRALKEAWPGRPVPEARLWPGYVVTRIRLLRQLEDAPARRRAPNQPGAGTQPRYLRPGDPLPPFPWVERTLEDPTRGLFGRPDRVETRSGGLEVIDLKAGVHQGEPNEWQWRQLILYAHLVGTVTGTFPSDLAIVDLHGGRHRRAVSIQEIGHHVTETQKLVEHFRSMCDRQTIDATPNEDACQSCPFRTACSDYWRARTDHWTGRAIRGTCVSVDDFGLVIQAADPAQGQSGLYRLLTDWSVPIMPGDEVVAVDLERGGFNTLRLRWDSRLRYASGT